MANVCFEWLHYHYTTYSLILHSHLFSASNPSYFTQRDALCGDVHLRYTILRFIPKICFNERKDELKVKDVNHVAPNSDIIDIHYSHTSNANGANKGMNEPDTEVNSRLKYIALLIDLENTNMHSLQIHKNLITEITFIPSRSQTSSVCLRWTIGYWGLGKHVELKKKGNYWIEFICNFEGIIYTKQCC